MDPLAISCEISRSVWFSRKEPRICLTTEAHLEKGELFPVLLLLSVSSVRIPGCDAVFQLISPSVESYASHSPEVNNGASHSVVFPSNNPTFAQK
jgi:hypothetical protein